MGVLTDLARSLGLGFGSPLALLPLLALPVLWFLLRATPPAPKRVELPSAGLLLGLESTERTPLRAPLWLVLLRLAIAALLCIGLARPSLNSQRAKAEGGDLLIVVDDGFASVQSWDRFRVHALAAAEETLARGGRVHALFTAPRAEKRDVVEALSVDRLRALFASLTPVPWAPDRPAALASLQASALFKGNARPSRILFLSDGLSYKDETFGGGLTRLAPVLIRAADLTGTVFALDILQKPSGRAVVVSRPAREGELLVSAQIEGLDGVPLASAEGRFKPGQSQIVIDLPAPGPGAKPVLVRLAGPPNAGRVRLFSESGARPRVGLAVTGSEEKPLLSDFFYIERALGPHAEVTRGKIAALAKARPAAMIIADEGGLPAAERRILEDYVEKGGVLIRFAGPRLAAQADSLVPARLRSGERAFGGALAWERPQMIARFTEDSPFFGLRPAPDALVRQQVLAEPGPELAAISWARLQDGTPLVTGAPRGKGLLVLFHVTASPDWSDLPLSGLFVDMLRRVIALRATPDAAEKSATTGREAGRENVAPFPLLYALGADGRLTRGKPDAPAFRPSAFAALAPGPMASPGLYGRGGRVAAVNVIAPDAPPRAWKPPPEMRVATLQAAPKRDLAGRVLGIALLLAAFDLLVALLVKGGRRIVGTDRVRADGRGRFLSALAAAGRRVAGGFRSRLRPGSRAGASIVLALSATAFAAGLFSPLARAQEVGDPVIDQLAPSIAMRLAFVRTNVPELDRATRAGLLGLSRELWRRTSVEPASPDAVDPETADLSVYPLLYWAIPDSAPPLSPLAAQKLNEFMRNGGALVIDTRDGGGADGAPGRRLGAILTGLDAPPLERLPERHVLNRAFFLLKETPGRFPSSLWVEAQSDARGRARANDGVSPLFIGGGDWAGAWAVDERGRAAFPVDGGEAARELAFRFGINLVVYALTGNYKDDQVHLPALIERLNR